MGEGVAAVAAVEAEISTVAVAAVSEVAAAPAVSELVAGSAAAAISVIAAAPFLYCCCALAATSISRTRRLNSSYDVRRLCALARCSSLAAN